MFSIKNHYFKSPRTQKWFGSALDGAEEAARSRSRIGSRWGGYDAGFLVAEDARLLGPKANDVAVKGTLPFVDGNSEAEVRAKPKGEGEVGTEGGVAPAPDEG